MKNQQVQQAEQHQQQQPKVKRHRLTRTVKADYMERWNSYLSMLEQHDNDVVTIRGARSAISKTFSFAELKEFRRCYTNDSNQKYATARFMLPLHWFINPEGDIISMRSYTPHLIKPTIKEGSSKREYLRIDYTDIDGRKQKVNCQIGTLVNLTFGGDCTKEAEKALKEKGLSALINCCQLSHVYGNVKGQTEEEVLNNRAINCALDRTQILTSEQHAILTRTVNGRMKDSVLLSSPSDNGITVYMPDFKGNGTVHSPKQLMFTEEAYNQTVAIYRKLVEAYCDSMADQQHESLK